MEEGNRLIITTVGYDRVGIIAAVSNILAEANVNILDISQKIMQGFFTMMMVVDVSTSEIGIPELRSLLSEKAEQLQVEIAVQHEDIFKFMHRI